MAILIGTTNHTQQPPFPLPDLPAVRNNVTQLFNVLTAPPVDLVDPSRCRQLLDQPDPSTAGLALRKHCAAAEDVLLVYYAGHGLVDDDGELYLALPGTDSRPDQLDLTAIPFARIRTEMHRSPARTKILILDCCYAGRAINTMSTAEAETTVADSTEIDGAFTLTATSRNHTASAPAGEPFTAFTGELLSLLQHGPPDDADLTLAELFRHLKRALRSKGLPLPQQRNTDRAADLILRPAAGKPAPAAGTAAGTVSEAAAHLPPATYQPVIDTLSKPRTVWHPLFRQLLAPHWRRLPAPLGALAATFAATVLWWQVSWHDVPVPRWIPLQAVLLCFAASVPALALLLTVPDLVRGHHAGVPTRDVRIKRSFAITVWVMCVVAVVWAFWIEPALTGTGISTWIVAALPLAGAVAALAGNSALGDLRARRAAPAAAAPDSWRSPAAAGVAVGLLTGGIGRLGFATFALACLTFWVFGRLLGVRVADCFRTYAALRRPLTLKFSRDGMAIRRPAHDRFIRWHDLDRVFVAGNILAIAFKRDYPESAKPQELPFSLALNGFRVADIRHFPHSRQDVLQSLSHFAGATMHPTELSFDDFTDL
ncbi:hypothetical protein GCM10010532_048000 [Dactylosporangium siamense]|uniref:Peptidase C14 caspase domain-containing protein n=1 Tax=Dactylosporangium siamense TaxID=685454 RepID=A0A919UIN3_9ACTN|nr:hypothetical protein Dsi01nite_098940 [Dactylosporangium siamense]